MTDDTDRQSVSNSSESASMVTTRRAVLAGISVIGTSAVGVGSLPTFGAADNGGTDRMDGCSSGGCSSATGGSRSVFTVRIENVSTSMTLTTTAMDEKLKEQPVPISPGTFAVHRGQTPLFTPGKAALDNGLESIAEDGKPMELAEWLSEQSSVSQSGAFTTPVGADAPAPLLPGDVYAFEIEAMPGERLSFATMFVPSNDLFYSPGKMGIELFERGEPIDRDVTDRIRLWDVGTEINEEPGVGEHQAQRQRGPGVGLVEREVVAPIGEINGYTYPDVSAVIEVTVSP